MTSIEKVILITGAARRFGLALALHFHSLGLRVFIHTHKSVDGQSLSQRLNEIRPASAQFFACDLRDVGQCDALVAACISAFGRLDILVNNASVFRSQKIGEVTLDDSVDQLNINLIAPLLLSQAAKPHLEITHGSIVNMTDIRVYNQALSGYALYNASKAGLDSLTRSLALEFAPTVRVNGLAISTLEWPEDWSEDDPRKEELLARIPLKRCASYEETARSVEFVTVGNQYITGQIVNLDGGASIA